MLTGFEWNGQQPGLALILESEALAVDADDRRVVQDTIEHRRGEHAVAGESAIPTAEGKIRSEDHRTAFIALRHDLEEHGRVSTPPSHSKVIWRPAETIGLAAICCYLHSVRRLLGPVLA